MTIRRAFPARMRVRSERAQKPNRGTPLAGARLIGSARTRDNRELNAGLAGEARHRGQFSTSEEARAPERNPAPTQPICSIPVPDLRQEGTGGDPERRSGSSRGGVPRRGSRHRPGGRPGPHSPEQGGPAQEASERPDPRHRLRPRLALRARAGRSRAPPGTPPLRRGRLRPPTSAHLAPTSTMLSR